jgi:hypothetical protein
VVTAVAAAASSENSASNSVTLAADQVAIALAHSSLSYECSTNPEDLPLAGTGEFSAKHWSGKAQEYAEQTQTLVNGDFIHSSRTINGLPLSTNIVLAVGDIPNLVNDLSGKAPLNHLHAIADVAGLQDAIDFNFALAAAGI